MTKHTKHACSDSPCSEPKEVQLPAFTFAPFVGKRTLDELEADLVLITKLYRTTVPATLHLADPAVAGMVKSIVKKEFSGKKGQSRLVAAPPADSDSSARSFMLVGLGQASSYCGETACETFEIFFRRALSEGARKVIVPFIPNPTTAGTMTHKLTAKKLKRVLTKLLAEHKGEVKLEEVQIYCTPAAVRSIREGLAIQPGTEDCGCAE